VIVVGDVVVNVCVPDGHGSTPPATMLVRPAKAALGKIAHAIINKVAADTAIRPAVVSRRPALLFLRCAGIDPSRRVSGSHNRRGNVPLREGDLTLDFDLPPSVAWLGPM
jgi:hypothetical protein